MESANSHRTTFAIATLGSAALPEANWSRFNSSWGLMGTGATDMSQVRPRGVQCYGIGAMRDHEGALKGFGAHSDQERIPDDSVYKHLQFYWSAVTAIAGAKF